MRAVSDTVHYMTSLLKQDEKMSARMDEIVSMPDSAFTTSSQKAIKVTWKEALGVPQRGC